ncbi:MAG TPA: pitrilysin family protein, partial [Oligoflexia bacterium]|nr:pitrilysin family protein [Oligoflexia bacterium]
LRITTKELAAEKKVVFQERQLRVESNVMAQAFEKLNERLFLGHPYGRPVIGYKEDLENATIQDCLQFFEQHYLPENALVVVAGNFDFKQTRKWIRDFYLSKSNSKIKKFAKAVVPPAPQLEKSEAVTVRHEVASDSLLIGYPLPSMYHDDAEALSMAAWYLFGMASSPMVDRMVRKTQVATSVNGSASFEKHGGAFLVNVDLRNGISGEQGLNLLDQVLNDSMEDGISNEALQNMKRKMLYSLFNEGKSVVGVADWFGSGLFYWNDPGRMRAVFEKYQDMTGESLERVIRKYLLGAKRVVVKVTR